MPYPPLHIVLTDPHSDGGGQVRYLESLAGELIRQGHAVTIGCRTGSVLARIGNALGCEVLDQFYFARGARIPKCAHDIRLMRTYLRERQPDIVHASGSQDHWVAGMARLGGLSSVPLLRTRHNTYPVKRGMVNRLLNRRWTTWQIAVCEMVRQDLATHPAFEPTRLSAIHNGVDPEMYAPDPAARRAARAMFGFADNAVVFGIAARLVKAKGHTYLFDAAAQSLASIPDLQILVMGEGVLEESLRTQVRTLGLDNRVVFAGYRDDMSRCVQAFDIGVLPSIDCDTSSFSLKEQMAAGIPVIASDYGGLPEVVTDGVEGVVVPNGTVEPLADAMCRLAKDEALRRQMGQCGRSRVLQEFSLTSFATRTVEVYRAAIAAAGKNTMERAHEHTAP